MLGFILFLLLLLLLILSDDDVPRWNPRTRRFYRRSRRTGRWKKDKGW